MDTQKILKSIDDSPLLRTPIDHIVIDNFLPENFAHKLASQFNEYNDEQWHRYSNSIEEKRTCNKWNEFKDETYLYFHFICSTAVTSTLSKKFGIITEADYGLHGGGQHIHSKMGNLNPHLDYSIHPKTGMERRLNAIYYLTDDHVEADGGHFGLWDNKSADEPGDLVQEYAPLFNRIVIFNTSQQSWHGLSRKYNPEGMKYRKSLASYYTSQPRPSALPHTRALFHARADQKHDTTVLQQIKKRSSEKDFASVYVTNKN